jgi:hypothetical protein
LLREIAKIEALEADPHTFLDVLPYRRFITAPIASIKNLLKKQAAGYVLHVKAPNVPGEWVEVPRASHGLTHQSMMSGQRIITRDGIHYIKEYGRYGTFFDDYRNGVPYEYKARQGNLMRKNGLLPDFIYGKTQQEADAQLKAARDIPLVWRVGADQVKAFEDILILRPQINVIP